MYNITERLEKMEQVIDKTIGLNNNIRLIDLVDKIKALDQKMEAILATEIADCTEEGLQVTTLREELNLK